MKFNQLEETRYIPGKAQKHNDQFHEKYKRKMRKLVKKTSSELAFDMEDLKSLANVNKCTYKIKGNAIVINALEKPKEKFPKPILFKTILKEEPTKNAQNVDQESSEQSMPDRGIIRYKLSDHRFISKGWTMLPTEKVIRKKFVYYMRPAHPEFDWFKLNKNKGPLIYDTGETLADFDDGRGRWYYKNGRLALDYYDTTDERSQHRVLVYSNDEQGRSQPVTILAMFDFMGNGVIFDHSGKIRLKYNQSDGVVLDRNIGPRSHWKWHSLNDPPILEKVLQETYLAQQDIRIMEFPDSVNRYPRSDNTDVLDIEFGNCVKEQSKKMSQKYQLYPIKMKALKINEYFSARIIDQANVFLTFKNGSANFKLNLGMVLDNRQILTTETEDIGNIFNPLDNFCPLEKIQDQSESILDLQQNLDKVRYIHRLRVAREQRIYPILPEYSTDRLNAAQSRPLHRLRTVTSQPSKVSSEHICKRKPPPTNMYYDNRLY